MKKRWTTEQLWALWAELMMKFAGQVYQISAGGDASAITIKLKGINKEIRDALIIRRFSSQSGVDVGFFKPRRLKPNHRELPKNEAPIYKVWLTVYLHKEDFIHLLLASKYNLGKFRDLTPEEFEKCLDQGMETFVRKQEPSAS